MWIADDTIVAISTPAGRGGIGIVRLSGAAAKEIAERLVRLKRPLEPGRVRFAEVMDEGSISRVGGSDEVRTGKDEMRGSFAPLRMTALEGMPGAPLRMTAWEGSDMATETVSEVSAAPELSDDIGDMARVLDQAVVTWFKGPRSYTGEDVVEIAVHGAPVLLDALVRRCVAAGARLARPGEFTERAFLSGRIDLTQAEAVDDLIHATTLEQARTAARQMGGGLSRQVRPVKDALIGLIAGMEAGIDFAEDDLEVMSGEAILAEMRGIEAPLSAMEESFAYGRVLREGFRLAIVGRPNAGKSSLFNRLVRRDRAIVTAQPGTTRDPVAERLEFAGVPVELVDTAGLRVAAASGGEIDEAEAMGVAKSREVMAEADVVLLVVAADEFQRDGGFHEEDVAVMRVFGGTHISESRCEAPRISDARSSEEQGRGLLVVMNKVDLVKGESSGSPTHREKQRRDEWGTELKAGNSSTSQNRDVGHPAQDDGFSEGIRENGFVAVETSAVDGTGIEELRAAVLRELKAIAPGADTAPVTNLRQHDAVTSAVRAVRAAMVGVEQVVPHEMVLIDLHEALDALDGLTGTTHTEEILGVIFSRFCVGK